ncbi:MAG TPA: segregation/condensation protein A [Methanoregulaceae archaeon]|nr:segregation/condensation protein A [Methanoregulaceae archaeon]
MIEEPVAILVGMAERGEIDPWRIDIVEVTDRFLSELEHQKTLDLRISGRTLFYAALLLRMKSEYLLDPPEEDGDVFEEDELVDWDALEEPLGGEPIARLEAEIHRRLERKRLRKRPETLFDLITVLRYMERDEQRRRRCVRVAPLEIDPSEVIGIAHEEGYRDAAHRVLAWCLAGFAEGRRMTISSLVLSSGWRVIDLYLPLLFLMLDGTVELVQVEFYGEIEIRPVLGDVQGSEIAAERTPSADGAS